MIFMNAVCDSSDCKGVPGVAPGNLCQGFGFDDPRETYGDLVGHLRNLGWSVQYEQSSATAQLLCPACVTEGRTLKVTREHEIARLGSYYPFFVETMDRGRVVARDTPSALFAQAIPADGRIERDSDARALIEHFDVLAEGGTGTISAAGEDGPGVYYRRSDDIPVALHHQDGRT